MAAWRPIKGYEGAYEVSDGGDVRSVERVITCKDGRKMPIHGKVLSPGVGGNGYKIISLWKNNRVEMAYVHRLVAETFIDNPEGKPTVNHKDGDRLNNQVSNLEWATYLENNLHEIRVLGRKGYGRKLSDEDVRYVLSSNETCMSLARRFGVSDSVIVNIRKGRIYKEITRGEQWGNLQATRAR